MCSSIVPASANRGQLGLCVLPYFTPVLDLYWANTGTLVILVSYCNCFSNFSSAIFLARYRPSIVCTNLFLLAQYRACTGPIPKNCFNIGPVLDQYRICGIDPIQGQYKQIGTGPVSGLYWANTEKLFQYWVSTGPIPDMRYWANTGASTKKSVLAWYRPSIGPVPGRYCKTVLGQYKYGVQNRTGPVLACGIGPVPPTLLGQYWASTVMFAGYIYI